MDINSFSAVLSHCDHTLLSQTATLGQIEAVIDEAKAFKTASVCIPPCYVREAKKYAGASVKICTVIGFPNGYSSINVGALKEGNSAYVEEELKKIKGVCERRQKELGRKIIMKVIIETCLLSEHEKIEACKIVTNSGADYIKTSTGFSSGGATLEDIALIKRHIGENVKIKAAGGISSLEEAEAFINAGCDRIGSSRIVKLVKERLAEK